MTFYERPTSKWRSWFNLTEKAEEQHTTSSSPLLDNAAAVLRTLNSEESVRPMLLQEEDINAEEQVQYSLFPRIIPPRDQREPDEAVMVVCATPHPKFIPFKEEVYLSYGKDIQGALEEAQDLTYNPSAFVKEMSPFDKIRDRGGPAVVLEKLSFDFHQRKPLDIIESTEIDDLPSTQQQEAMVPRSEKDQKEKFPSKSYTQFAVPISALKPDGTLIPNPNAAETAGNTKGGGVGSSAASTFGLPMKELTISSATGGRRGHRPSTVMMKSREMIDERDDY
ncbi:hypothetical protein HDU96_000834 [Phlyctochytrium bullatum]|nr:hypothetical protein HDU96_000834 [Phlyctochytrium bullatum]